MEVFVKCPAGFQAACFNQPPLNGPSTADSRLKHLLKKGKRLKDFCLEICFGMNRLNPVLSSRSAPVLLSALHSHPDS